MGKKKSSEHVQQSLGQMVSKAALMQLMPSIESYVDAKLANLGGQIAAQQASTLETMFSRIIVLESILMEKLQISKDDLVAKVSDLEDRNEGLALKTGTVAEGDVVRLEISTKSVDQSEYQGTSRLKASNIGSGRSLGKELESALIGMSSGETKVVKFGQDQKMEAKIVVNRISTQEANDETQVKG